MRRIWTALAPLLLALAALMSTVVAAPARAQGQTADPLSPADTHSVTGWIARKVASARQQYCYRQSYGRGVGIPLSTCGSGSEKDGLLCYPSCPGGYHGVGPVCWESCPAGYTDTGALCTQGAESRKLKFESADCPHGFHNMGASCYRPWPPKSISMSHMTCPAGMSRKGGFCYDACPPGFTNTGTSCYSGPKTKAKKTTTRTAGKPMQCEAGRDQDAGLCYGQCKTDFHGVGPVCWENCPAGKTACGAGCASSTSQCASSTANMVIAPLMLASNILSAGASEELTAARTEFTTAVKAGDTVAARRAFGTMVDAYVARLESITDKEIVDTLKKRLTDNAYKFAAKEYVKYNVSMAMTGSVPDGVAVLHDMAGVDPTGVAQVVDAFLQPKCLLDEPFPQVTSRH
ncbi:MAG: hypothetical protein Q8M91_07490 [Polaromonas sp.]|nr:hypothetical protein [Polaromonas sp.]